LPEITPLGWLHTALGALAVIAGIIALAKYKEITWQSQLGRVYLVATLITAATALGIFQHGSFGPGHALAVMTLLALAVGAVASTTGLFGKLSRYVRAISFSATLFFHSIPAITDGLLRLPVGDPLLASIDDPILRMCYLGLLVIFLVGVTMQFRWIGRTESAGDTR